MASKLCDSCKSATAALFCRADSAFLCFSCDGRIHAANKLASRHARVVVCEVCEQSPAHVTCKADAASLCLSCDRDIHSANPVAQKHDRLPVTPFYDSVRRPFTDIHIDDQSGAPGCRLGFLLKGEDDVVSREEEEEAASWLLPNPKAGDESPGVNSAQYLFGEVDPFLDVDYGSGDPKFEMGESNCSGSDGVVPVQRGGVESVHGQGFVNEGGFDLEFTNVAAKGSHHGGDVAHCLSHSVSSSSLDVGVVPDGSTLTDISNPYKGPMSAGFDSSTSRPVQLSPADREVRVLRYREKRKNRKFEKTIRYASRKAYAETRPRIKGRFAKRTEVEAESERVFGFGVVPSF
ncbi:LOW QUALITY PROTEIN: zinc finger protein CONSTANS-LIKE 4-like [Punica granatum]|uniref:LOW QUALITY PROTEIN: zinc finger protein CONSTANS-LIKE 4-like n=1 Tax=Punica granatum TaxID=22663 RepID=A0A6P8C1G8_PUNGR|nr:LOW QUALITY PROTEIN: zinc finger protein CONSTANS-LIKE 4-like [Punica granatum]